MMLSSRVFLCIDSVFYQFALVTVVIKMYLFIYFQTLFILYWGLVH